MGLNFSSSQLARIALAEFVPFLFSLTWFVNQAKVIPANTVKFNSIGYTFPHFKLSFTAFAFYLIMSSAIPTVKASSTKEEYDLIWGMPLPVVAGIGAVLLVFIIIIVALSCVLARKRCQKKSLPPIFTPHAHDNPTYITTELPPLPEPVYDAIPAEGATRGTPRDSHNSDLPDIVMTKEGIPLPDRPDLSPEQPSPGMDTASDSLDDESGIEADNFRSFLSDREHLVAGPFPVEVVVNVVDPTNQTVTYNAHL